jgi:hypothetical protein
VGGCDCGAHLDRRDLRYQRKQSRIVRRAAPAVVIIAAVGGLICGVLLLAALVQAILDAPDGNAVQVPPVVLPVGAVLGVDLVPAGRRGHAEPAGIAVLVLSSVGPAILTSEHAAKTLTPWSLSPYLTI